MTKHRFLVRSGSLWFTAVTLAFEGISLAEDVIVTGCVGSGVNNCPPSCAADLGTATLHTSASSAVPAGAGRSTTLFGISELASWAVTPTLATSSGAYRIYVSQGTAYHCSTNIVVKLLVTSGGTLADTNFIPQSAIYTTAFQSNACLNVWVPIAVITNTSRTPTVLFSYASGNCTRWYLDEVRFESLSSSTTSPAYITAVQPGNPLTITGTGPVSHAFTLVTSTNAAKPLSQWTPQQTNTAGVGAFSFPVTNRSEPNRHFRVITQ